MTQYNAEEKNNLLLLNKNVYTPLTISYEKTASFVSSSANESIKEASVSLKPQKEISAAQIETPRLVS